MNFLTVEQFAQRLKIHPQTVRRGIKSGRFYASRTGAGKKSEYRIAESELERIYLQGMCEKNKE